MCSCLRENTIFETLPLERCNDVSANNKWRIVVRTHSLVKGRNCCIELSSGKCVWVTLASGANSDCSQFSGSGFVLWFRPALDTRLAQRTSKPSRNISILFTSGLFCHDSDAHVRDCLRICVGGCAFPWIEPSVNSTEGNTCYVSSNQFTFTLRKKLLRDHEPQLEHYF